MGEGVCRGKNGKRGRPPVSRPTVRGNVTTKKRQWGALRGQNGQSDTESVGGGGRGGRDRALHLEQATKPLQGVAICLVGVEGKLHVLDGGGDIILQGLVLLKHGRQADALAKSSVLHTPPDLRDTMHA